MRINKSVFAIFVLWIMLLSNILSCEPGRLLKVFPSHGTSPLGLCCTTDGGRSLLYVMDYSKEGYQVYDTRTAEPVGGLVRTGQGPRHGIAVVGDNYYAPYFDPPTGDMVIVSAKLGVSYPTGVFTLKNAPWAFSLTHDGTDFWSAGARNTRKLFRFDSTGKILQTIEMKENLLSVTWGAGSLWVLTDARKVVRMDRSGKRLSELTLPEIMPVGGDGPGIAWDDDAKTLWIASGASIWNVQALTGYPSLPSVNASKLANAPVIDGKPNDRCWTSQTASSPFMKLTGLGLPANSTVVRTGYDNRNLYMLVEFSMPSGKRPKARKLPFDSDPWNDESAEILLTPYIDSIVYYQIVVNAAGSIFDKAWGRGVVDGEKWNSKAAAKTTVSPKGWILEIAIPLSSFPAKVQTGAAWRFQCYRNDITDKLESSAFAPTVTGKYHEPSQFGILTFGQGKVRVSDWRIGEPFYDGWPVEAAIENSSSKPVEVRISGDVRDAAGKVSKAVVMASIGAGGITTAIVSPAIHQDGKQTLYFQLQNPGNGSALSLMQSSMLEFDPLAMRGLRKISATAELDVRALPVAKRKVFQPTLLALNKALGALDSRLASGKVNMVNRDSAVTAVTSLQNRFSKLLIAAKASRVGWSNPDMVVCSSQPTDQLFPESTYISDPVREVKVYLAGRESECTQLVVLPIRGDLTDIQISSEAPSGPKGSKLSLEISRVGFINTVKPPTDMERIGLWPDPLLKATPFDVPADELRCVWVRVNAPAGAAAGDYEGRVTLTTAGSKPVSVAVKVHVWGFDLPVKPFLQTSFFLHLAMLAEVYGSAHYEAFMNYTTEMLRNRIAPSHNSIKAWYPDINFSYKNKPEELKKPGLWDKAEDYIRYCNANGFNGFYDIAYLDKCYEGYSEDYINANMRFLRSIVPDLKSKGLINQVGIYAWDEIEPENYSKHVQIAKIIKSEFPDIPILMVQNNGSAAEILKGYVDIWVPYITTYWNSRQTYLKEQSEGRQVWWYICMYPFPGRLPCPNVYVDEPGIDLRIVHWMEYKFGVTGYLYWGINYWEPSQKKIVSEIGKSGVIDWKTTEGTVMGNGEGYLFYPGPDLKPLLSVRLENFRDGMDDYDMLMMLKQIVSNPPSSADPGVLAKAKSLLIIPDDIVKSVGDYTGDVRKLNSRRKQVAEMLERLIAR